MRDEITFWRCPDCYGTGRKIVADAAVTCSRCDGTGNAFVDGRARRHQRELDEIDRKNEQ